MAEPQPELVLDCEELKRLLTLTTRDSVKAILNKQVEGLESKVKGQGELAKPDASGDGSAAAAVQPPVTSSEPTPKPTESQKVLVPTLPTKTITSYGWDQSAKFVKLYVTLAGVQTLPKDNVTVDFTSSSCTLRVKKNDCIHQLIKNSLLSDIIPDKSHFKVKTDSVVIFLKKNSEQNWECVTKTEQKTKQKSKPAAPKTDTSDPSAGIMGLMKQMYDDGDDEMKRSIAKAWTEARDKKSTLDMPGMPGL